MDPCGSSLWSTPRVTASSTRAHAALGPWLAWVSVTRSRHPSPCRYDAVVMAARPASPVPVRSTARGQRGARANTRHRDRAGLSRDSLRDEGKAKRAVAADVAPGMNVAGRAVDMRPGTTLRGPPVEPPKRWAKRLQCCPGAETTTRMDVPTAMSSGRGADCSWHRRSPGSRPHSATCPVRALEPAAVHRTARFPSALDAGAGHARRGIFSGRPRATTRRADADDFVPAGEVAVGGGAPPAGGVGVDVVAGRFRALGNAADSGRRASEDGY